MANLDAFEEADLVDRDLLLLERSHCLQRLALSAFPDLHLETDEELAATVAKEMGLTLLPNLAVDAGMAKGHDLPLVELPIAWPRQIALAWRRNSTKVELFRALGALIVAAREDVPRHQD